MNICLHHFVFGARFRFSFEDFLCARRLRQPRLASWFASRSACQSFSWSYFCSCQLWCSISRAGHAPGRALSSFWPPTRSAFIIVFVFPTDLLCAHRGVDCHRQKLPASSSLSRSATVVSFPWSKSHLSVLPLSGWEDPVFLLLFWWPLAFGLFWVMILHVFSLCFCFSNLVLRINIFYISMWSKSS
jgi:hypothetical protein